MKRKYQVTGIGNAIVDIIALISDDFLQRNNLIKGSMTLIDNGAIATLASLPPQKILSGGSVANSIAALADLGAKTALIGKVGHDRFGDIFFSNLKEIGVDFYCRHRAVAGSTAQSFVLVTPDAQRTMCTYLGNASDINSEIDEEIIADSEILYLEGYLWDKGLTITALRKAVDLAKKNHTKIAFTLSDSFCVERHQQDFLELIPQIDILFANRTEIQSLLKNPQITISGISEFCNRYPKLLLIETRNEDGAVIFSKNIKDGFVIVPTTKMTTIYDTTGAGDCFAAGFLYGLINNCTMEKCAAIGNFLAGQIIQKLGARFDIDEVKKLKQIVYDLVDSRRN